MRHYFTIQRDVFGQVRLLEEITKAFQENAEAHPLSQSTIYFEGCYLSSRVFETITRDAIQTSESTYTWFPKSAAPLMTMIFEKEELTDRTFYQVKVIQNGVQVLSFVDVSGMKFFFVFDDEDTIVLF